MIVIIDDLACQCLLAILVSARKAALLRPIAMLAPVRSGASPARPAGEDLGGAHPIE